MPDDQMEDDPQITNQELEIHHLNVDQGESTLIVVRNTFNNNTKALTAILIDGGHKNNAEHIKDYAEKIIKIKHLDYVFISHFDEDHWGGIKGLIEANYLITKETEFYAPPSSSEPLSKSLMIKAFYELDKFKIFFKYCCSYKDKTPRVLVIFRNYLEKLFRQKGADAAVIKKNVETKSFIEILNVYIHNNYNVENFNIYIVGLEESAEGDFKEFLKTLKITKDEIKEFLKTLKITKDEISAKVLINIGEISLELKHYGEQSKEDFKNNNSLCWLLTFNNFKYFTGGDAESSVEDDLFKNTEKITVFKAGHHGSDHSTSKRFIQTIKPEVCIISCGNPILALSSNDDENADEAGNTFDHPTARVIKDLLENNTNIFVTNLVNSTYIHIKDQDWYDPNSGYTAKWNDQQGFVLEEPHKLSLSSHYEKDNGFVISENERRLCTSFSSYETEFLIKEGASPAIYIANSRESYLSLNKNEMSASEKNKHYRINNNSIVLKINKNDSKEDKPKYNIKCGEAFPMSFPPYQSTQPSPPTTTQSTDKKSGIKRKRENSDPSFIDHLDGYPPLNIPPKQKRRLMRKR
jgi:beta-lactamase superfamily II metal-dependent hydrolase